MDFSSSHAFLNDVKCDGLVWPPMLHSVVVVHSEFQGRKNSLNGEPTHLAHLVQLQKLYIQSMSDVHVYGHHPQGHLSPSFYESRKESVACGRAFW